LTPSANTAVAATFEQGTAGLTSINHIIFFAGSGKPNGPTEILRQL
jgi:hypothetical protein